MYVDANSPLPLSGAKVPREWPECPPYDCGRNEEGGREGEEEEDGERLSPARDRAAALCCGRI